MAVMRFQKTKFWWQSDALFEHIWMKGLTIQVKVNVDRLRFDLASIKILYQGASMKQVRKGRSVKEDFIDSSQIEFRTLNKATLHSCWY